MFFFAAAAVVGKFALVESFSGAKRRSNLRISYEILRLLDPTVAVHGPSAWRPFGAFFGGCGFCHFCGGLFGNISFIIIAQSAHKWNSLPMESLPPATKICSDTPRPAKPLN